MFSEIVDMNKITNRNKELSEKLDYLVNNPLWQSFSNSSSDIRKKYYFRISNNMIYYERLSEVKAATNNSISDPETISIAFLLSVLPYILQELSVLNDDIQYNDLYLNLKAILLQGLTGNS